MTDDVLESPEEQQAYEAREVQQLLRHDGWRRAVQSTQARIIKEWERAGTPLDREMCWHKLQAFKSLQQELRAFGERRPLVLG